MGDDIPTIFKELDNRTDDEGEYKMMVDETVVFDYVDVAYVDGFPEIRLSLQTYDDFMDDNAYLSEMFIFPRDVFECSPKHPSTESLREQMAYHYPSEYKKNIIDTIPDYTGDYNQVIAGLKNYQINTDLIDMRPQDIGKVIYERIGFSKAERYDLEIQGPIYSKTARGEFDESEYVSKIDEAHILAINPRNEISGESEFADLELIVATKHPEDPEVYVALVVPIESLKTISDTIVDDFGFSEMLGGYEKLYMVEQDFLRKRTKTTAIAKLAASEKRLSLHS